MPNFKYTALDQNGVEKTGIISADNKMAAMEMVRAQGLLLRECEEAAKGARPTAAKESKKGKAKKKSKEKGKAGGSIKQKELMVFTRQLATLIDAGLPLLQSLNVLSKQEPNPNLRATITALSDSVQGGSTFSEALSTYPKMFNRLFVNMVKAGEIGGVLEVVLRRLAEYQEKANKLRGKITSAMVYPLIIMTIAVGILIFLMLVIVPKFKEMFEGQNMELPALSQFVFNFSDNCMHDGLIPFVPNAVVAIGIIFLACVGISFWKRTPKGARVVDAFILKVPKIGHLTKVNAVARFSRTFGTLVSSGVPILQALVITRDTAGNVLVADAVTKIHDSVREGESIVTPMSTCPIFPPMMISMVDVGEETGQLPDMLMKVAEVYDDEVDNSVTALTAMLEPLMIVFLAVVVGGIVLAMFMPMMEIIKNV
ncbi:MAG: type II secretion system F family protein [Akkermansia sp.]|nr:type II secretion system F family protein [Akkermansia sp.]MBR1978232.1 type II secretion system F family protein [Akkermansia sp.]